MWGIVVTMFLVGCLDLSEQANSHWVHKAVGTPALFMDEGPVAIKVADAHVMVEVSMESLKKSYDQLLATLLRVDERNHNGRRCGDKPCHDVGLINVLKDRVCSLHEKLAFLCSSHECSVYFEEPKFIEPKKDSYRKTEKLPEPKKRFYWQGSFLDSLSKKSRNKRFVAEILGTLGLGLGLYDLVEIEQLRSQIKTVNREQGVLVHAVNDLHLSIAGLEDRTKKIYRDIRHQSFWLGTLQAEVDFASFILEIDQELDVFEEFLDALLQTVVDKRIAPRLFSTSGLDSALQHLSEQAHALHLELAGTGLADLADAPLSWILRDNSFEIFLHLAVVSGERMRMYKWIQVPVHVGDGTNFGIRTRGEYLAVTDDSRKFREMALFERQHCEKRSGVLICPAGVLQVNPEASCLASLFLQKEKVSSICSFEKLTGVTETMVKLSRNCTILVPAPAAKTATVRITCHGRHIAKTRLTGVQRIEIGQGCVLSTASNDFEVLAGDVISANLTIREMNLPNLMDKAKILEKGLNDILEEHGLALRNGTLGELSHPHHGRIVHEKVAEGFGVIGVVLLTIIVAIVVIGGIYLHRRSLQRSREKTIKRTLEEGAAHFQLLNMETQ